MPRKKKTVEKPVEKKETLNVKPHEVETGGSKYLYFEITNTELAGVIFCFSEFELIEKEKSANARVVFVNTGDFTSSQLVNNDDFRMAAKSILDHMVAEHFQEAQVETEEK